MDNNELALPSAALAPFGLSPEAGSQAKQPAANAGGTCNVCNAAPSVGVASSALGPCSWAYCGECLNKPAEPECMFAATIDGCDGPENIAAWVKQLWTWRDGAYVSWDDWCAKHFATAQS